MRLFLLGLMFVAFVVAGPALVVVGVWPLLPALLGFDPAVALAGWRVLLLVAVALPLPFAALYASGLLWLVCACRLFRRDEVERIAHAGPHTRLERWLFERFTA
ncbi:MAG: hypothetical protein R3225_04115 [Halofilum sp. (in: g-proteobacteria)]|nr:hypothetical protein [Halofilum sp. (in: g-proteobacteria)]